MNRSHSIAYLLLCVAALAWAGNFIVGRYIHAQVTPVTLSYGRWGLALLLLLPFTLPGVVRQWSVIRRRIGLFALLGERLLGHHLVGISLIIVAIYLTTSRRLAGNPH